MVKKPMCPLQYFKQKSYSIIEVAKMFKSKIVYLPSRPGERFASALTKISQNNHITHRYGKIN